jgi:hypothetical protein
MARNVADGMWEMLVAAGVRRCYGIAPVPAKTAEGFTLSLAKQVLTGKMDDVIETVERNVRLL